MWDEMKTNNGNVLGKWNESQAKARGMQNEYKESHKSGTNIIRKWHNSDANIPELHEPRVAQLQYYHFSQTCRTVNIYLQDAS